MSALPPDNQIQPFQIENMAAQGRLVRLGDAVQAVLGAHDYPRDVARHAWRITGHRRRNRRDAEI